MTGLIERLRDGLCDGHFSVHPNDTMAEAADALEALRGHAVHTGDCATGLWPPQQCDCGLSVLFAKLGNA